VEGAVLSIRRLAELATPKGTTARAGAGQGEIERISGAALRIEEGRISFAGPEAEFVRRFGEAPGPDETVLDGRGKTAVPGFVDPHTHLAWAGFRESEFGERLKGRTYAEIAARGGGIAATVAATRAASREELAAVPGLPGKLARDMYRELHKTGV